MFGRDFNIHIISYGFMIKKGKRYECLPDCPLMTFTRFVTYESIMDDTLQNDEGTTITISGKNAVYDYEAYFRRLPSFKEKYLTRFYCNPKDELSFTAIKLAAEIGGVDMFLREMGDAYPYLLYDSDVNTICGVSSSGILENTLTELTPLEYVNCLKMSDEDLKELDNLETARIVVELSDDRFSYMTLKGVQKMAIINGNSIWQVSEDGLTVSLKKRD